MTVDDQILTLLNAAPAIANVHDGYVDADESAKVISVPLPFVLYYGKRTSPTNARAGGRAERGNIVAMTCAGQTRQQADWLADKVGAALDGAPLGNRTVTFLDRDDPHRDKTYTRPDNRPIFYAAIRFTV
jgi:hypothetical protein